MVNVPCQFGHTSHQKVLAHTEQGRLWVYDPRLYATDEPGWCPGRNAVCDTLFTLGHWELHDTAPIDRILRDGDRSRLVIDFGACVGWYTILAANHGYNVLAVEAEPEFAALVQANAEWHEVADQVVVRCDWVDENFTLDDPGCDVELVKIDLEGFDRHAVQACWSFIDRIHNFYIEISPVFRPDYPQLVDELLAEGFHAYWPDDRPFDHDYSLTQFNLRFSR